MISIEVVVEGLLDAPLGYKAKIRTDIDGELYFIDSVGEHRHIGHINARMYIVVPT